MFNLLDKYNLEFGSPVFFFLLILLPVLIYCIYRIHKKRRTSLTVSTTGGIARMAVPWKARFRPLIHILNLAAVICFIAGLARMQETNIKENIESEGVDIVLSMDISGSMLAEDFQPNRLEAAKTTAVSFVKSRPGDRFGVVIFAGESFTQCPITIDHNVVIEQLSRVTNGLLEEGTAIGMGMATAIDRLKDTKGKSRILVLLTDGVNTTGLIYPETALELAKAYNVKVYTIGVGTEGKALFPVKTHLGIQKQLMDVKIDEALLQKISRETGGRYFRATDNTSLETIYAEIDRLEKTTVQIGTYKQHKERFHIFVLSGLTLLMLSILLQYTLFRKIP